MLLADVPQSSMLQQYLVDGMILGALIHIGDLFTKIPEYQERMSTRHILKITSQTALEMKETVVQNGETRELHAKERCDWAIRSTAAVLNPFRLSLLACVVVKPTDTFEQACTQLMLYMVILQHNRNNTTYDDLPVYGMCTDGIDYIFMTLTQNKVIHKSRLFTRSKRDDSKIIFSYLVGLLQKIVEDVEIREPKSKIIHQGADY